CCSFRRSCRWTKSTPTELIKDQMNLIEGLTAGRSFAQASEAVSEKHRPYLRAYREFLDPAKLARDHTKIASLSTSSAALPVAAPVSSLPPRATTKKRAATCPALFGTAL
ncbi:MAG: hypothetical protein V4760_05260, partial [Bdellovibrionota bacterium]